MKRVSTVLFVVVGLFLSACQKQQTEEERNAQIEREVQNRLAAEQQKQKEQELAQRQADLDAREQALAAGTQSPVASEEEVRTSQRPRPPVSNARELPASYDLFYTRLDPYGSWIETRDYGYVWQPREARSSNWRPYANGHWVYTDSGWTWVSEEPFGWAAYHYGRWTRLRNIGWIWVPGDEWAPAWVSWRKSDDYVGWAPLPPEAHFDRRTGIGNWADNYYDIGPTQYCFVPTRAFGTPRIEQTIVPPEQNVTIINRTTNVTNITYNDVTVVNQGPSYDELRARVQQPIPRFKLERRTTIDIGNQQSAPVVRGEVIEMTAPVVARAQSAARPREVRQTITQTEVDHGWTELGDTEGARQARAKMKSEATPPPDAPPKTVSRTNTVGGALPPLATTTPHLVGTPRVRPVPSATIATASPAFTQTPPVESRPTPTATTPVAATPRPTPAATPRATAAATPRPTSIATPQSTPVATPPVTPRASPSATAREETTRDGRRFDSERRGFPPGRQRPGLGRAEATPGSSVAPSPPGADGQGPDRDRRRGRGRPGERAASPRPTPSPSATTAP